MNKVALWLRQQVSFQVLHLLLKLTTDSADVKSSCVHFLKVINQLQRFVSTLVYNEEMSFSLGLCTCPSLWILYKYPL